MSVAFNTCIHIIRTGLCREIVTSDHDVQYEIIY